MVVSYRLPHYYNNNLLRHAMCVVKRSDDTQMRVKEGPVITKDDTLLRVVYLRRALRVKEGHVIKEDDTHLRVVKLRHAFRTRIAYH